MFIYTGTGWFPLDLNISIFGYIGHYRDVNIYRDSTGTGWFPLDLNISIFGYIGHYRDVYIYRDRLVSFRSKHINIRVYRLG